MTAIDRHHQSKPVSIPSFCPKEGGCDPSHRLSSFRGAKTKEDRKEKDKKHGDLLHGRVKIGN